MAERMLNAGRRYPLLPPVGRLARGEATEASDAALTPEGHGIRYDGEGRVIGVTIINARWLLERDGHVTITLPQEVHVPPGDLAGALS